MKKLAIATEEEISLHRIAPQEDSEAPIELLLLENEKDHSFRKVSESLGIPLSALHKLAAKRSLIMSDNGRILNSSYLLLGTLITYLCKRYERVDRAKSKLGAKAFNKAVQAGSIQILSGLEMEVVPRTQLDKEMQFQLFIRTVNQQLGEELTKKSLLFIFRHQDGCNPLQLEKHLFGKQNGVIYNSLVHGRVNGIQEGRNWHIPFPDMILAISTHLNWVVVHRLVDQGLSDHKTIELYARLGHLGPTRIHFSGALAINKSILPQANSICESVKADRLRGRSYTNSAEGYLKAGELSPDMIAEMLQVSHAAVLHLMDKKHIPYKMRQGHRITRSLSFFRFVGRASRGEIPHLKTKTKIRCRELLLERRREMKRNRMRRWREKQHEP